MAKSKVGVYILESLYLENEKNRELEGRALRDILRMLNCPVKYRYFRTNKELKAFLAEFQKSMYRYLHLSCHGDEDGFGFTLDELTINGFSGIAAPYLDKRRLFISSCKVANNDLARLLFKKSNIYSVAGPAKRIAFADACVSWASFYNLVLKDNKVGLLHDDVIGGLQKVCVMMDLKFNAFFRKKNSPFYRRESIGPKNTPLKNLCK